MRKAVCAILVLFALAPSPARADDDDPEPPGKGGPELRKLRGTWTVTRGIIKGRESKPPPNIVITYVFDGDKMTYDSGKVKYVAKVKVDTKNKPFTLEVTRDDVKTTRPMAFKIENGELFLAQVRDKTAKEDFKGINGTVMVLKREKK